MISFILNNIPDVCLIGGLIGLLIIITNVHDKEMISVGKKFIYLSLIAFVVSIIGQKICAIDIQLATVQVEIVGQNHIRGTYHTHVEYNDQTYHLEGKDIYDKYIDKVGRHVAGTLKTTVYVDGSEHKEIVELQ